MAVHSHASGSRLATPSRALRGSSCLLRVRWDSTASSNAVLSHRGSGFLAWTLTTNQAIEINSSTGSPSQLTTLGRVVLGQYYWIAWSISAAGVVTAFIGSALRRPSGLEAVAWSTPNTITAPNDTASYSILGLQDFGFSANAAVDKFTIWDGEVTRSQFEAAILTSGAPSGCWAHYPLADAATALSDTSGNGRNLTSAGNAVSTEATPPVDPPLPGTKTLKGVAAGNSLVKGYPYGGAPGNTNWPDMLATLRGETWINSGDPGSNVSECQSFAYGGVFPNFDPTKTCVVTFNEYTNDDQDGFTGAQTATRFAEFARFVRARGFYCLVATGVKFTFTGYDESERLALNASLLTDAAGADKPVCDLGSLSEFSDPNNTTYFDGDKIHWATGGNTVAANAWNATINSWLGSYAAGGGIAAGEGAGARNLRLNPVYRMSRRSHHDGFAGAQI